MKNIVGANKESMCLQMLYDQDGSQITNFGGVLFAQRAMHSVSFLDDIPPKLLCLLRAMHRTDMACPPINLFTYWKVVLVKLCKQGFPQKLPGKCSFILSFSAQDVRERLETFLEWTPEWKTQGQRRQQMDRRKEIRRSGTRW